MLSAFSIRTAGSLLFYFSGASPYSSAGNVSASAALRFILGL